MLYCFDPVYLEMTYEDGSSEKVRILTDQLSSDLMIRDHIFQNEEKQIVEIFLHDEKMKWFEP